MSKAILSRLTEDSSTLCVVAVEEVRLESVDEYVTWASRLLDYTDGLQGLQHIVALAELEGDPNLFEVRELIGRFMHANRLQAPRGKDAIELFALGLVRAVAEEKRTAKDCLPQLAELSARERSVSWLIWFSELERWLRWRDTDCENPHGFPIDECEAFACLVKRCDSVANSARVKLDEGEDGFSICVTLTDAK